jgi:hypothetical protein
MASDFSAAWQCLSKRTIVFFVTDQTPRPHLGDFFHKKHLVTLHSTYYLRFYIYTATGFEQGVTSESQINRRYIFATIPKK